MSAVERRQSSRGLHRLVQLLGQEGLFRHRTFLLRLARHPARKLHRQLARKTLESC
jgi:hypothetical protein